MKIAVKKGVAGFLTVSALIVFSAPLPATAASSIPTPVVVELYTSQGCSSCPPADELLGELAAIPNVIALSFHVDYWDSIGWHDGFSIPEATHRQARYVETLGLSGAFTPQMVIDGRVSFVGSDRRRILSALARTGESIPVTAVATQGELIVTVPERAERGDYDVNTVAYLSEASTAIGRGENGGRTLKEYHIVRQFRRLATWDGNSRVLHISLNSFPRDATHVAVLLQHGQQGMIAGSAVTALR